MTNSLTSRFEIRFSPQELDFLDARLCQRDETLSAWVRAQLDSGREAEDRARRMEAAKRIGEMNVDLGISDWADFEKLLAEEDGEDWA